MADDNEPIHVSTEDARGGSTPGVVRWMLGLGLTVVIVGMALIWLVGRGTGAN